MIDMINIKYVVITNNKKNFNYYLYFRLVFVYGLFYKQSTFFLSQNIIV